MGLEKLHTESGAKARHRFWVCNLSDKVGWDFYTANMESFFLGLRKKFQ